MNDKIITINKQHDTEKRDAQSKHEKEIKERIAALSASDLSLNAAMEALRIQKDEAISSL